MDQSKNPSWWPFGLAVALPLAMIIGLLVAADRRRTPEDDRPVITRYGQASFAVLVKDRATGAPLPERLVTFVQETPGYDAPPTPLRQPTDSGGYAMFTAVKAGSVTIGVEGTDAITTLKNLEADARKAFTVELAVAGGS